MIDSDWKFLASYEALCPDAIRHDRLQDGLELLSVHGRGNCPTGTVFTMDIAPIQFSFHLEGDGDAEIVHTPWRKEFVTAWPGTVILSFNPHSACRVACGGKQTVRIVNLYLSPDKLRRMFADDPDALPLELHRILDAPSPEPCNRGYALDARAGMLLEQLGNCPYRGALRRLYLESKAMELMVLQMERLRREPSRTTANSIRPDDEERIRAVRDLLVRDTDKPPSLGELARWAGLNETKLKRGFRHIFGTTVCDYVRNHRLDQSRELLAQGRWSVTEIAHRCDFHDATHFIKHFKRRFGTTPGSYMKAAS